MKKCHIIFIALLFVASFCFVSFLQAAEITSLEGTVQVQTAAEKAWRKADKGMMVNIGDSIRTARRSRADIALDDEKKNIVRIEGQTLVVLNSASPGMIDRFDLSKGKVYANIESIKAGLTFEVSTPSSVAGARGTGYSVDSNRRNDEVATFRDEVYVKTFDANKNLIKEITVPEGFKTLIERFQGPSELIQLTDNEKQRWNEMREDMAGRKHEAGKFRDTGDEEGVMQEVSNAKDLIEERGVDEAIDQIRGQSGSEEEYHYLP